MMSDLKMNRKECKIMKRKCIFNRIRNCDCHKLRIFGPPSNPSLMEFASVLRQGA